MEIKKSYGNNKGESFFMYDSEKFNDVMKCAQRESNNELKEIFL